MIQQTLLLIKPNATAKNVIGRIIDIAECNQFRVKQLKMFTMSQDIADQFYEMHKGKSFFQSLCDFMTSGHTVAVILEKDNAIEELRLLVGNTDPVKANPGTIRHMYGESVTVNAVHASDSEENAIREINIIFYENE
ncbi:MAG: nucleoside-diphosphate kinase [Candidatus Cloacimonetes bacterium]|jgi:nucleoside-diphosphate kinase|nr:nucleoside-diphosphate kinase [Candidatus Cloacimonadota bacterium]HPM01194.1 nucleoside-diphosphate kinase [Candidatus Cloacimonadota bacterium]